jgi:hypothetical protein
VPLDRLLADLGKLRVGNLRMSPPFGVSAMLGRDLARAVSRRTGARAHWGGTAFLVGIDLAKGRRGAGLTALAEAKGLAAAFGLERDTEMGRGIEKLRRELTAFAPYPRSTCAWPKVGAQT